MPARSRTGGLLLAFGVSAASIASLLAQQAPPRPAAAMQAPLTANSVIAGQVVDAGTGRGVPGALVVMTGGAPAASTVTDPAQAARLGAQLERGLVSSEQAAQGGVQDPRRAFADAEGRFVFRDLTRGNYSIAVTMTGYSPGAFGRQRSEGPSRQLELAENQRKTDAVVRLWKFGVISGTVSDEAGEPMIGVTVRALRRLYAGGRPRLGAGPQAVTDDRGMYRISSLPAGDYVVVIPNTTTTVTNSAIDAYRAAINAGQAEIMRQYQESGAPRPSGGLRAGDFTMVMDSNAGRALAIPPADDGRMFVYPTQFYPGTTSSAQATVVTLGSGDDRAGVDLALRPVPAARVSGNVTGPDGPAAGLGVRLIPADADALVAETGFETATAAADAAGGFMFLGVPAGQYTLKAYRVPRPELPGPMAGGGGQVSVARGGGPPPTGPMWWAEMPVTVGDANVTGLALTLRDGIRVSGQVVFEGTTPKPLPQRIQNIAISLGGVDSRSAVPGGASRADAEGRFTTSGNPPGRYWPNATPPGPEWILKSVMVGAHNALEQPLVLESSDIAGVVVTFTDRTTELSGSVTPAAASAPDQEYVVLLFPVDYQSWISNGMSQRRAATATATAKGTFQMRVALPGDYLVAAVGAEVQVEQTPQFYAALSRSATRVSFTEGETKSISLPVSRVR